MFCWTGYVLIPRCWRYFTGLIAPNEILIRFSLYQRMYLSSKQIKSSSVVSMYPGFYPEGLLYVYAWIDKPHRRAGLSSICTGPEH